jgi:hypothetical protein
MLYVKKKTTKNFLKKFQNPFKKYVVISRIFLLIYFNIDLYFYIIKIQIRY